MHPRLTTLLIIMALASATSCSRTGASPSGQTAKRTVVAARAVPTACAPVRLVVDPDQTRSTDANETPIPLIDEVRAPVERLFLQCGGEILIGVVREDSHRRLKRLAVLPPPQAPQMPSQNENPLMLKTQVMPEYEAKLSAYKDARTAWEKEARKRLQAYFDEAKPLLEQKPFANRSDVFGSVNRADSALAEPDAVFGRTTSKYLVLVSDGQDNVHKERPVMRSGAKLLLVNGSGSSGSLEGLVSAHFESVAAAVQYVAASEGVH